MDFVQTMRKWSGSAIKDTHTPRDPASGPLQHTQRLPLRQEPGLVFPEGIL